MLGAARRLKLRASPCSTRALSSSSKPPAASSSKAEKDKAARELVFGEGGEPPKMPYPLMAFTACVLGSYVAYVKMIEEPAEQLRDAATPPPAPLPDGASKRLPDGRLLMADGSIQSAPPS